MLSGKRKIELIIQQNIINKKVKFDDDNSSLVVVLNNVCLEYLFEYLIGCANSLLFVCKQFNRLYWNVFRSHCILAETFQLPRYYVNQFYSGWWRAKHHHHLMVTNPDNSMFTGRNGGVTQYQVYLYDQNFIYIPRQYGLDVWGYPTIDLTSNGISIDENRLLFTKTLMTKPNFPQDEAVAAVLKYYDNDQNQSRGCILKQPCGTGKTWSSLYIFSKLGVKTLVILHFNDLVHQWKDAIQQCLPHIRVGIIQQDICEIEDKDIVLLSLQTSLSAKRAAIFKRDTMKQFGFCIIDEVHHIVAEQFSTVLRLILSKYVLGLTATPVKSKQRKDRLKVLQYLVGPIVYSGKRPYMKVYCKRLVYKDVLDVQRVQYRRDGRTLNLPAMQKNLALFDEKRNNMIIQEITQLIKHYPNKRRIMTLVDRKKHVSMLAYLILQQFVNQAKAHQNHIGVHFYVKKYERLVKQKKNLIVTGHEAQSIPKPFVYMWEIVYDNVLPQQLPIPYKNSLKIGTYFGKMNTQERQYVLRQCDIIIATSKLAEEALNEPTIDTILNATFLSNVEQIVGRALRVHAEKSTPLILDFVDAFSIFEKQSKTRLRFFKEEEYIIVTLNYHLNNLQSDKVYQWFDIEQYDNDPYNYPLFTNAVLEQSQKKKNIKNNCIADHPNEVVLKNQPIVTLTQEDLLNSIFISE